MGKATNKQTTKETKIVITKMGSGSSSAAASPDAKAFIDGELGKHQVVVFSKSYCPYCAKTKSLFGQSEFKDIDVATYELDQRGDGAAIQQTLLAMSGQRTVPSVWVGGKFVGGNSETQSAYKSGELQSMLGLK